MDEAQIIKQEIEELLKLLTFEASVEVTSTNDVYLVKILTEDNPSLLIGKHGQTLRSIDRILTVIIWQKLGKKINLSIDVNDYRLSQQKHLVELVDRQIEKINQTGQSVSMRNFTAYERKVIHEYITNNHPELQSHSEGEGEERILIISKKEK